MKIRTAVFTLSALLAAPAAALADHYDGGYVSFGGGNLVVGASAGTNETFALGSSVTWVDDAGTTVDYKTVKVGRPMTIHYVPEGKVRRVERVVVHKE